MSVLTQHYYRNTYLKSEHWSTLRLEKMVSVDARCAVCKHRDLSNDVHHIKYRSLWDCRLSDLRVLCRKHHNQWHKLLDDGFHIQAWSEVERWRIFILKLKGMERKKLSASRTALGFTSPQRKRRIRSAFKAARCALRRSCAIISRDEMPWDNRMISLYRNRIKDFKVRDWLELSELVVERNKRLLWPCGEH